MREILVIRLPRAWKWVSNICFYFFFPGKGTISRRSSGRIKHVLNLYAPKTKIRAHIRYRGHKQKIVAGVKSVNRFNKISLGQKGLLLTTNRVLVWNSPGRRRSLASLLMPLVTRPMQALRVRRCATEKGFSGLSSDATEKRTSAGFKWYSILHVSRFTDKDVTPQGA